MNKDFEIELIDCELESLRSSKVLLMEMVNKKRNNEEHTKTLFETLELNKKRERKLLELKEDLLNGKNS